MAILEPVTTVADSDITPLSGTPVVGGYQLTGDGTESVCLTAQDNPLENDIYQIPSGGGAWERRADFDTVTERAPFTEFWVLYGDRARTKWYLWNTEAPEPGVDPAYFQMDSRGAPSEAGGGLERSGGLIQLQDRGMQGLWQLPTIETDQYGLPISISSSELSGSYIEGLALRYVSDTQVALDPGAAFIPGISRIVEVDTTLTVTPLAGVHANYYAYLYESNGEGALELSTIAPSEPYFAHARTMEGDNTRRYLGMLKNNQFEDLIQFEDEVLGGSTVLRIYGASQDSDNILAWDTITSTTTTTLRTIGPSSGLASDRMVPASCRVAILFLQKSGANTQYFGWPLDQVYNIPAVTMQSSASEIRPGPMRLSPTQQLYHKTSAGTNTIHLFVLGYYDRR
jgi:hypothetical protein